MILFLRIIVTIQLTFLSGIVLSQSELLSTEVVLKNDTLAEVPDLSYSEYYLSHLEPLTPLYQIHYDIGQMLHPFAQPFFFKKVNGKPKFSLLLLNLSDEFKINPADNVLRFDKTLDFLTNINLQIRQLPDNLRDFKVVFSLRMKVTI